MKDLENWFFDKFISRFLLIIKYFTILVGIIALSYFFSLYFGDEIWVLFFLGLGMLLMLGPKWVRNKKIEKRVKELIEFDKDSIKEVVNQEGQIDYIILNKIKFDIINKVEKENTIEMFNSEYDSEDKKYFYKKVEDLIIDKYRNLKI